MSGMSAASKYVSAATARSYSYTEHSRARDTLLRHLHAQSSIHRRKNLTAGWVARCASGRCCPSSKQMRHRGRRSTREDTPQPAASGTEQRVSDIGGQQSRHREEGREADLHLVDELVLEKPAEHHADE